MQYYKHYKLYVKITLYKLKASIVSRISTTLLTSLVTLLAVIRNPVPFAPWPLRHILISGVLLNKRKDLHTLAER